jgi:agmatine deiminase
MKQFSDLDTNVVYFSQFFAHRFPGVFGPSKTNLKANGIQVRLIPGNFNIWCRDYMPLQVGDHFVQFGYKGYSSDGLASGYEDYPWLIVPEKCFDVCKPLVKSEIVLDGGGVIRSKTTAIITEKVFLDNPSVKRPDLIAKLQKIFNLDVVIIPIEPGDTLGHSDGICKFIDGDKHLLVNDYSSMFPPYLKFHNELMTRLGKAGITVELMPYAYGLCPQLTDADFHAQYPLADDNNPAVGYCINFLLTKSVVLAPAFGIDKDEAAIATLRKWYPKHAVIAIDCKELSMEGGLMSCTSWNVVE